MTRIICDGYIVASEDETMYQYFGLTFLSPVGLRKQLEEAGGEDVVLEINCSGGDLWAAVEMRNELRNYKGKTTAEITGLAASAATVVMTGCKKVVAALGAHLMIHNTQTYANGDYRDLEAATQMLVTSRQNLIDIYVNKTGKSREELGALLDKETWMSAQDAMEMGFVDEIKDSETSKFRIAANIDAFDYQNLKAAYFAATTNTENETKEWQNRAAARLQIEEVRYGAERVQK